MLWLGALLVGAVGPVYAGPNGWTTNGPLLPGVSVAVVALAIDPQTPATVYAGGSGALFKSTNGGGSWALMNQGLPTAPFALAIDPQTPATVYAGILGGTGGVYKSANGGGSWTPMANGLTAPVGALAIDPLNSATVYAGAQPGGVFKSTNGGGSWTPMNTGGLGAMAISALAIDPNVPTTIYAGAFAAVSPALFKSSDGGAHWAPLNTGPNSVVRAIVIDPETPSTLYAATAPQSGLHPGVLKSSNGGGSWAPVNNGLPDDLVMALAIDPHAPATIYAGTFMSGVFKSVDGGGSWTPMNTGFPDPLFLVSVTTLAVTPMGTSVHAGTTGGASGEYDYDVQPDPCAAPQGPPLPTSLVAAVLPSSRSVQVGATATVFATIVNSGTALACGAGITLATGIQATFQFNATDCATNAVIGGANVPVNVAAGAAACYVLSITPTAPFAPTEVAFTYQGTNTPPVPPLVAINTLLMSASTSPVPDIVALAATVTNDGIVHIPGPAGAAAFAVATSNLGFGASITVSATTGGAGLPLSISVCETDPILGTCVAPPSLTVPLFIAAGATPTFGIFASASGTIPLDPAASRVYVLFSEAGGTVRGRTSVAVTTE